MTIHVNIGTAKTRLSELVAAARSGEDVITARSGKSAVKLVPVNPEEDRAAILARRFPFFGSVKGAGGDGIDWSEPTYSDEVLAAFETPFRGYCLIRRSSSGSRSATSVCPRAFATTSQNRTQC